MTGDWKKEKLGQAGFKTARLEWEGRLEARLL